MEPSGAPWRVLDAAEPETATQPPTNVRRFPWLPIAGTVLAAAVALVALLFALRPDPGTLVDAPMVSGMSGQLAGTTPASSPTQPTVVVVDVGGAVAEPGVYRLGAGARVGDAIAAAGGYSPRVDAERADVQLNLAAVIHDGDQIHVPARGEAAADSGGGATDPGGTNGPIDLNRATSEQLDTLPGVGPVTAAKIIAAREQQPFASVDDLATRKVVGNATLDKIRDLVTVGP